MPNNLTGDYDAVLLIAVARINGILATLHQNGVDPDASPTFPHSESTRIGDHPKVSHPPFGDYAGWFNEMLSASDSRGDAAGQPGANLTDKAPLGAAKILRKFYADIQAARADEISPPTVPAPLDCRGKVEVQIGTPSITFPAGSTSEITVNANIRARFTPDPNTPALPEPVHGLVSATYSVTTKHLLHYHPAKTILEVTPPTDDNKIQFTAAANSVGPVDANQIASQVRKALREGFEPINVELPSNTSFARFKALGNGQALALPIRLTAPFDLPESSLNSVANNFLNGDFSVAISREYFQSKLQPTISNLQHFTQSFSVGYGWASVTYHVSIKGVNIEWHNGYLDLVVHAKATASYAPDFDDITVRQRLTVGVYPSTQHFFIGARDSDLSISGVWDFVKGRIRSAISSARDAALPDAESQINAELVKNRTQLNDTLHSIDNVALARFSGVRITPDGIIIDGGISSKFRAGPQVRFAETSDGTAFTAFESWIPAGRIDRFDWSWVVQNPITAWGGSVETHSEAHRYIFPKPSPTPGPLGAVLGNVCLRIHGIQVDQHGYAYEIAGGTTCIVQTPEVAWAMPSWSEPMPTPTWSLGIPLDGILEEYIRGHINVLAHARPGLQTANSIVHFADAKMDHPLENFAKALDQRPGIPLALIVVLPSGTFNGKRREVEAKLGSLGKEFRGQLILTEDYTGSWKRTFDAKQMPSTYLMNTKGEFVWKQEGAFDPNALVAALDKYLGQKRVVRSRPVNLLVRQGDRSSDLLFADDRGQRLALRKLRGHPVLLNFWQSWSAPSIRELQRLENLHGKDDRNAPVIIAICGDEKPDVLTEVRRKYNLTFALVHDPQRSLARSFGVHCWPTTVSIDSDGIVNGIQLGAQPDTPDAAGKSPAAA